MPLSDAENAILELVAGGLPVKQVAARRGMSDRGVEEALRRAYSKMGAENRSHAVYMWTRAQPRDRRVLPDTRTSLNHKVTIYSEYGDAKVYLTLGRYTTGELGEVFLRIGNQGSTLRGSLDSWSRMVSVALQWGVPIGEIIGKFKGVGFEPCGKTNNKTIPECTSVIDYAVRWIELQEAEHGPARD